MVSRPDTARGRLLPLILAPMLAPLLALILVLTPGAGAAAEWTSPDRIEVRPLANGGFEVLGRGGYEPMKYWCGAGDYALLVEGAPSTHRLYLTRGQGPSVTTPGRRAMQFALRPPAGAEIGTGLTVSLTRPGENLSVSIAREQCWNEKMFD